MRFRIFIYSIFLIFTLWSCEPDNMSGSADEVVTQDELVAYTDQVVLLLSVQVKSSASSEFTSAVGTYLHPSHFRELSIYIENDILGTFSINTDNVNNDLDKLTLGNFNFNTDKNQIIVKAERENNINYENTVLSNIGDWVNYLDQYISPGSHIFQFKEIKISDAAENEYTYTLNNFSFATVSNESTILSLGEVNLEILNFGK